MVDIAQKNSIQSFVELTLKNLSYNQNLISPEYDALMREFVELLHRSFVQQYACLFSLRHSLFIFLLSSNKKSQHDVALGCMSFLVHCVEETSNKTSEIRSFYSGLVVEPGSFLYTIEYQDVQKKMKRAVEFKCFIDSVNRHFGFRAYETSPREESPRMNKRSNSLSNFMGAVFSPRRRDSSSSDSEEKQFSDSNGSPRSSLKVSPKRMLASIRRSP